MGLTSGGFSWRRVGLSALLLTITFGALVCYDDLYESISHFFRGSRDMAEAQQGDTVKVHYKGTLEDGSVFDDSHDREPLEFTIGGGEIIPGFEEAVVGMEPGDTKTTEISSENAYGPHREDLVASVSRNELPEDLDPEVGQRLQIQQENGQSMVVEVTETGESDVTLDGNHPLAGEDLTFKIELVDIEDEEE